ncbi:hypothetical protein LOC68_24670 [Blastopirellula sp. JC732]|uniref:Alpha/beta hydrolase n=1 Tax=Blastopirellula sediminis TaxID=2894196 RepID=A0A9X1SIH1_9BACT|nr:hypothetical protein [Blastopirellula sediminis]MCC9605097.1 hypothetical protein [Blastopirellula sediminis]MCC9631603.1 hypothetical protein [Blastopirellula sediminis]
MKSLLHALLAIAALGLSGSLSQAGEANDLTDHSQEVLTVPPVSSGAPAPGKRVAITSPEYAGTEVRHYVYLPPDWEKNRSTPIIFEYTGNYYPASGSTGRPEDAALGYGLSGGRYIWVSLPYVNQQGTANEPTWWGDEAATIQYAKVNVPRIIQQFGADPNAVFLCGFSRGAIGVNYLGLHDDEIAKLWTAFVTHDHFDGARAWVKPWGSPLDAYRESARQRLARVAGRPYWVSQNGSIRETQAFVQSAVANSDNFHFAEINATEILGSFPNATAKSAHTDRWLLKPSRYRSEVWTWMNKVEKSGKRKAESGQEPKH